MPAPRRPDKVVDPARCSELSVVERKRIISMDQAERLSSLSEDGWREHHPDKVVRLSPKRVGVRLEDALFLPPLLGE
jgi:hypothetical protein